MVMATSIKDMELVVITTDTKLEDIKLVVAYAYGASWWRFQQVQRFGAGGHGYKYKGYGAGGDY